MSKLDPQILLDGTNNTINNWNKHDERVDTSTASPISNQTQKSIKELLFNGTGYYIEDEGETGLNDLQTLFLACFATLIPLVITLFTAFGIRILWTKYKRRKENAQYDGIHHDGTTESISKPLHSHLLSDKCGDTNLAISTEEVEVCDGSTLNNGQSKGNNHSNTNGSIITMTLKNNHLIVETEERNDIEEDSRETTMKYSPGARNGVFVVEVQQGVRRSPGSGGGQITDKEFSATSDQCALVHNPPDRFSDEDSLEKIDTSLADSIESPTINPRSLLPTHTGLTQSNSSLNQQQPSYCYTNQQGYDNGNFGYPIYSGYINDEPLKRLPDDDDNRPKIMSAVYKNPPQLERQLTDVESVNVSIMNCVDDEIQEEQNRLGGAVATAEKKLLSSTSVEVEQDVRSTDYENKGFDCNYTVKS